MYYFCILLSLTFLTVHTRSQVIIDNLRHRMGIVVDYDINFHSADFKQLPNVDNCCPRFESGSGSGWNLGVVYDQPLWRRLSLGVRLSYQQSNATLLASESVDAYDLAQQIFRGVDIEHRIDTKSSNIGIDFLAQLNVVSSLRFLGGLRLSQQSAIHYDQAEQFTGDGFVFKENMSRTRNVHSGEISNVNTLQSAILIGASVEFPLNAQRTFLIAPEILLQFGLSNLVPAVTWSASACRFGVALKFATPPMPPQVHPLIPLKVVTPPVTTEPIAGPAPSKESHDSIRAAPTNELSTTLSSKPSPNEFEDVGIEILTTLPSGDLSKVQSISNEEMLSHTLIPLLGYIFFSENSSDISSRYERLSAGQSNVFKNSIGAQRATMTMYHHVLNVVGLRMREHPSARLVLSGCNADNAQERGNKILSLQRAESIRDYLRGIWGIAANRMTIEARNLPEHPSQGSGDDAFRADQENRRVEIRSDDPTILEPVMVEDTILRVRPDHLIVARSTERSTPFSRSDVWVHLRSEPSHYTSRTMYLAKQIRIPLRSDELRGVDELVFRAQRTENDTAAQRPTQRVEVEHRRYALQTSSQQKHRVDKYKLILFAFDKTDVSSANASILNRIRSTITAKSEVSIEGYTDIMGDSLYNERLSSERAQRTASMLGLSHATVTGWGERAEFDNALPEGRFYNRSVSIIVDSPTE